MTHLKSALAAATILVGTAFAGGAQAAVVFSNLNGFIVTAAASGPLTATTFTLASDTFIGSVWNYHFPITTGALAPYPGYVDAQLGQSVTITLTSGSTGALAFTGEITDDLYGAPYHYAHVVVNQMLPADTYTVTDSLPGSWSFNSTSNNAGFTLVDDQPVPEPASLAVLAAGLIGLGAARRRRA